MSGGGEGVDDHGAPRDRVDEAREELAELEGRPVDEHPDVFAEINETIVDELSAMEDV